MASSETTSDPVSTWTDQEVRFLTGAFKILLGKSERIAPYFRPPKTKEEVHAKIKELKLSVPTYRYARKVDRGTHALIFKDHLPPQEFYRSTLKCPTFDLDAVTEAANMFRSLHSPEFGVEMNSILASHVYKDTEEGPSSENLQVFDFIASAFVDTEEGLSEKFENLPKAHQTMVREALHQMRAFVCTPRTRRIRDRVQRQSQALHRVMLPAPFHTAMDRAASSAFLLNCELPAHRQPFNPLPLRRKMRADALRRFHAVGAEEVEDGGGGGDDDRDGEGDVGDDDENGGDEDGKSG